MRSAHFGAPYRLPPIFEAPVTTEPGLYVALSMAAGRLPGLSLQMAGEMLVHFKHGHLVLAEDPPELVVGQDFAAVLWVLQVVRADVLPHLAHHLPPGQRTR